MASKLETLKAVRTDASRLRRVANRLKTEVRFPLQLDPSRGQEFEVEGRQWTFVMTAESSQKWDRLGREPVVVGVLANDLNDSGTPDVERILVALPSTGSKVKLEMRDADGVTLWKGSGRMVRGDFEFSIPISRSGVKGRGNVAGRMSRDGKIALNVGNLPAPPGKRLSGPASVD